MAKLGELLQVLGSETRLEILHAIGTGEACVCHLEALLGYRQAYISQQLMALREAGLLDTRREGKYIFYRLASPEVLEMIRSAGRLAGVDYSILERQHPAATRCECPSCSRETK
jgi:ArsR family transcriptional regulator